MPAFTFAKAPTVETATPAPMPEMAIERDKSGKAFGVLRFALDGDFPVSKSGKSLLVCSTHGGASLDGTVVTVNLNVSVPLPSGK